VTSSPVWITRNSNQGSAPSTFTAANDGDGKLTAQTYPSGLVATTRYDDSGDAPSLVYAKSGTPWLSFLQESSVNGRSAGIPRRQRPGRWVTTSPVDSPRS
jgi:hypothetical protein